MLSFLTRFLAHCLDVGRTMAGPLFAFLFSLDESPLEVELQRAIYTVLQIQGPMAHHQINSELPDVAAGRADIAIIFPTWRCVIEVKRELENSSRESLKQYLGQTSAYQATQPKIGFLVVLDLCSQINGALSIDENCWLEEIKFKGETEARNVVVIRIPGRRKMPSKVTSPEFHMASKPTPNRIAKKSVNRKTK